MTKFRRFVVISEEHLIVRPEFESRRERKRLSIHEDHPVVDLRPTRAALQSEPVEQYAEESLKHRGAKSAPLNWTSYAHVYELYILNSMIIV